MSGGADRPAAGVPPIERTVLRTLVDQLHLRTPKAFRAQFLRAAAELAEREVDPEFSRQDVSERQFGRWLDGAQPRPYACRVLEFMFGVPVAELLRPAARPESPVTLDAAHGGPRPGEDDGCSEQEMPPAHPSMPAPPPSVGVVPTVRVSVTPGAALTITVDGGSTVPVRVVVSAVGDDGAGVSAQAPPTGGARVYPLAARRGQAG